MLIENRRRGEGGVSSDWSSEMFRNEYRKCTYCVSTHYLSVRITDRHFEYSHACFHDLANEMIVFAVGGC